MSRYIQDTKPLSHEAMQEERWKNHMRKTESLIRRSESMLQTTLIQRAIENKKRKSKANSFASRIRTSLRASFSASFSDGSGLLQDTSAVQDWFRKQNFDSSMSSMDLSGDASRSLSSIYLSPVENRE